MSIDQLAAFFGWMTLINIAILLLAWLFIWLELPWIALLVRRIFPVPGARLDEVYLR